MALLIKNLNGLAYASVKNRNGLAVASIKSINGLDATGSPVTYSDNFNRTENPLSDGGAWTNGITGYANMQATGLVATSATASVYAGAIVTTPSFASNPNQIATITLSVNSSFTGAFVRMSVAGNGYRIQLTNSTTVQVHRIDAGVATQLGSNLTITGVSTGVTLGLGIVGTGSNNITVYRNGVAQGTTFTDANHTTGAPGVMAFGTANTVDSFSCTSV